MPLKPENQRFIEIAAKLDAQARTRLAIGAITGCAIAEFPATLGAERAPLTSHGLIDRGRVTDLGRQVVAALAAEEAATRDAVEAQVDEQIRKGPWS